MNDRLVPTKMENRFLRITLLLSWIFSLAGVTATSAHERDIHSLWQREKSNPMIELINRYFERKAFNKGYAIIVGLSDYTGEWVPLESPYHDAIKVRDFLIQKAGFDYVITLTNKEAKKSLINKYMEEVFPNKIGTGDRFLFYFSGHGTQRQLGNRIRGYLPMLGSGKKTWSDMISMDDIERWNENLHKAQHVVFLLDCCFSGLAGTQKKGSGKQLYLDDLARYGHHLITAGSANQESYGSLKRWGGSLFTDAFLRGISGRADAGTTDFPKDGVISLTELIEYIKKRLKEEAAKDRKVNQSPLVSDLDDNQGEFFFIYDKSRIAAKKSRERAVSEEAPGAEGKGSTAEEPKRPFEIARAQPHKEVRMSDWMNLAYSAVSYLPPLPDTGKPDFSLEAELDNGDVLSEPISKGRKTISAPFKLREATSVHFTIYERDWLSNEQITNTVQVGIQDLITGGKISFLIRNAIFRRYTGIDKNKKTISMSVNLENFDADKNSGPDVSIASPAVISPDTIFDNSVDFTQRDASDYVRLSSTNGSCLAILWAVTSSRNFVDIIAPKQGALLSPVLENQVANKRGAPGIEFIGIAESNGGDLILHFHADRPSARTDYAVFLFPNKDTARGFPRFIELFFEQELTTFGKYEFDWPFKWGGTYKDNLGIAVKALRKYFAVPAGSLIGTLDKYCKQGNKDQQKSAIKIIEAELDTYARANENPEYSSEIISQVIIVNKAEQGALTNSSELKQALNSESSEILLRSIKAIDKLEDKGFAREILTNLVLDERQDVSEASKEVLRSLMRPSSGK